MNPSFYVITEKPPVHTAASESTWMFISVQENFQIYVITVASLGTQSAL
jgi:hypothetical protein